MLASDVDETAMEGRGVYHLDFRCGLGEILGLTLITAVLTVVTLTIYRFWGRTRVRRLLWRRTLLLDDPLEYTGTGWELFTGFIKVLVLVLIPLILIDRGINAWQQAAIADAVAVVQEAGKNQPAGAMPDVMDTMWAARDELLGPFIARYAYLGLILFLAGLGVYLARRYRLTRTRWRGVRANQGGSPLTYGVRYLGFFVAMFLTLGLILPVRNASLWRYRYRNTWFGDTRFDSHASARGLYGRFILCWLFALPTLFLSIVFYKAKELRHFVEATRFSDDLRFRLEATGWSLLWLVLGNFVIAIVTLGLGSPIIQWRQARYVARRLVAVGAMDLDALQYDPQKAPTTGEGLAESFPDIGI